MVRIANEQGAIEAPVKLTDDLMTGVVAMSHGWGQGESKGMRVASGCARGELQRASAVRPRQLRAAVQPGAHDRAFGWT